MDRKRQEGAGLPPCPKRALDCSSLDPELARGSSPSHGPRAVKTPQEPKGRIDKKVGNWFRQAFKEHLSVTKYALVASVVSISCSTFTTYLAGRSLGETASFLLASAATLLWYPVFFGLSYARQDRKLITTADGAVDKEKRRQLGKSYLGMIGSGELAWQGIMIGGQFFFRRSLGLAPELATAVTHAAAAVIFAFGTPVIKHAWFSIFMKNK